MKLPIWVTLGVGAIGAGAAFLVTADPSHAGIYQIIVGAVALIGLPVAHKAVS